MLMPPEAEPVMPASTLTATASEMTGLPEMPSTESRTVRKAGSEAMTAPYPTSLAVLKIGRKEPMVPVLTDSLTSPNRLRLVSTTTRVATTRATTIAQIPPTVSMSVLP